LCMAHTTDNCNASKCAVLFADTSRCDSRTLSLQPSKRMSDGPRLNRIGCNSVRTTENATLN
jgi:hypothetical protein